MTVSYYYRIFGMGKTRHFNSLWCAQCTLTLASIGGAGVINCFRSGMRSGSRDLFKFWEITDNMSETVQDRDIITIEG